MESFFSSVLFIALMNLSDQLVLVVCEPEMEG